MKLRLRENALFIAIATVALLILIGAASSFYNRQLMNKSLETKASVEAVLQQVDLIGDNMRFMDISARGFALIRRKEFLFWTVKNAQDRNKSVFKSLDSLFEKQGVNEPEYEKMKHALQNYTVVFAKMVTHLENNEMAEYIAMLEYDYGKEFYVEFEPFLTRIAVLERQKFDDAQKEYSGAATSNQILQTLLTLIGLPTLIWIFTKILRDNRERKGLLLNLEKNNKLYIFDNGAESEKEARLILDTSIKNFREASKFVTEIAGGNYDVTWHGMTDGQKGLNTDNLAGKLLFMRDEMKRMQEEDKKRLWVSQGLSQVSDVISKYQNSLQELTWQVLTFFVKYSGSQQGGFFMVRQEEGEQGYLELGACYAFDRKKFYEKKLALGQGLIGEVYLSGETMIMKEIPRDYINITSGLGDATPNCLVIVPLKHNGQVQAIIELASFYEYVDYKVQFLEKAGEFIASAIFTAEQNERTRFMMDQMRVQTEQLRNQEEELKQNIEELEATQETMRRQSLHVEK